MLSKYPNVFKPLKVGKMMLKNRIQFTPMVCCLSNAEGEVTEEILEFIGGQARTGVGNVTIGDSQIDHERGQCFYGELNVTHDKYITGLTLLVEEAHRYGAKLSIELNHSGRGASPTMNTKPAFAVSDIPVPGCATELQVMDQDDLDWVKNRFAECAERVKRAGFDMILIHSGHNNMLGQFLSPASNARTDEYGGSLENRMRFPLEVLKAVRERVGDDMVIEMRVSGDEMTHNGLRFPDVIEYVKEAQKYIDIVHFSCGNVFDKEGVKYSVPLYLQERQQNVKFAEAAKKVLDIPVAVVGNIMTVEEAEDIIASGKADIVGMCRSLMADPELIKNAIRNENDKTRPCLRCMDGCGEIFNGLPVRCSVNPVTGREYRYKNLPMANKQKKVVVVGGGPAGMMASQTLLKRGHEVTLFEKGDRLGGLLHDASALPFKNLLKDYTDWNIRTTEQSGATIHLNTEVTAELIRKENPDAVIIATGSTYVKPQIPGIDRSNVHMVNDVDHKRVEVGQKVVVCGGGLTGIESAVGLAKEGKDVTVVDMIPVEDFCKSMFHITRVALFDEVEQYNVKLIGQHKIEQFTEDGVVVIDQDGNPSTIEADDVVIALGLKSNNGLFEEIQAMYPLSTYLVGDSDQVKSIRHANFSAFNVAVEI